MSSPVGGFEEHLEQYELVAAVDLLLKVFTMLLPLPQDAVLGVGSDNHEIVAVHDVE